MKAELMIVRNMVMSLLTYRAHFTFQVLASVLAVTVQFFLWTAVFAASNYAAIRGMTFQDTFMYVSISAALVVLMKTWTDWDMSYQIRSGDIIMFLFKPIDHMKFSFMSSIGAMVGNMLTITIPSFIVIFGVLGVRVELGLNLVFFVVTMLGSWILSFLFDYFIGTTCFHTQSIWGISSTKDYLILFLSGAMIPLPFFPDAVKDLMLYLPFPYMYNLPVSILGAHGTDLTSWLRGAGIQVAWIVLLFVGVRAYFRFSIRKLTVAGG